MDTESFINFIQNYPTKYHQCEFAETKFIENGFTKLNDNISLPDQMPKKGFILRDQRSFVAYKIGGYNRICAVGLGGDGPCLKLKPNYEFQVGDFKMLRMAFNGKGKWETYIDRDLSAGGKVLYKADNGEIQTKLFNSKRGVAIIPNVGLDLKPSNSLKTNYNNEKSFNAIIGKKGFSSYVSELIGCKESDILDMDVEFTDSSPPSYNDDLLSSPRLFSQANFYCSLLSFLESSDDTDSVQIIGAFDNQQNNNLSRNSTVFLNEVIHSIFKGKNISEVNSKSIIVSCQSIDGRHPLNKTITDEACAKLGKGVSLNTSFRSPVASEPIGNGFIYNLSENQIQTNTHKNMRTGIPTIGPVLALSTGIRTVDIGIPVLANGSIRETMVWKDVVSMFNLITKIFSNIETLSKFEH